LEREGNMNFDFLMKVVDRNMEKLDSDEERSEPKG